jgi:Flagellar assembly protein FliH
MSDVRPLNFRRVEGEANPEGGAASMARPNWLAAPEAVVRLAPFATRDEHGPAREEPAPEPPPPYDAPLPAPPAFTAEPVLPRRSSLPPRKSVFPPQVLITRMPPPPEAEQKPTPEQEAFAQGALELASLRARVLSSIESELLSLAVHIAETIIEREVTLDPSLHTTLARTAVLALGDTQSARLRVSRAAYKAISELYGEAAIDVDGVRVEVSMDASFEALSVVAEAGPSRVNGRLNERLTAVLRAMEAEHRRNNAEAASVDSP